MARDVAAAEAVVNTVLHLILVINEDGNGHRDDDIVVLPSQQRWQGDVLVDDGGSGDDDDNDTNRVNKGCRELLEFSHPPSIRDDPGPVWDDRRPARHLSC